MSIDLSGGICDIPVPVKGTGMSFQTSAGVSERLNEWLGVALALLQGARTFPLNASAKVLSGMICTVPRFLVRHRLLSFADPGLGSPGARKCGQTVQQT